MTDYRRNFIPGGSYFFTVAMADRSGRLLTDNIELFRRAVAGVKRELPFDLVAMVALPEHLHCVWTLPEGDADYPTRWKKIKAGFSRGFPKEERRSTSRVAKGERGIWQRRFWEHTLRDDDDFHRHVDYIHYNPVKHGHVRSVKDWPYSTFHRFVERGVYPDDWAGGEVEKGDYGEGE
ncbi:MAG: transposase [Gallionella sp.]|nr:transposase [Gallionella sp.]